MARNLSKVNKILEDLSSLFELSVSCHPIKQPDVDAVLYVIRIKDWKAEYKDFAKLFNLEIKSKRTVLMFSLWLELDVVAELRAPKELRKFIQDRILQLIVYKDLDPLDIKAHVM